MDFEKKKGGRWAFEQWRAKFQIWAFEQWRAKFQIWVDRSLLAHVQDFQETVYGYFSSHIHSQDQSTGEFNFQHR